jgi:quercetin 2,3-dioxygenase
LIDVRPYAKLGAASLGWLNTKYHFSFAEYHDPERMHWGLLRVWNDDEIAPGSGFPPHPHSNMEIITYVRRGAISHQDGLGNQGRTAAGDVQVMSAGTGIVHAEYNREAEETRLFQIWIMPTRRGDPPSWGTKPFPKADRAGKFVTLASGLPGDTEALSIHSDARVLGATLKAGSRTAYAANTARHLYLVPAAGAVEVNGVRVGPRDGAAITGEAQIEVTALDDAEIVLVDAA